MPSPARRVRPPKKVRDLSWWEVACSYKPGDIVRLTQERSVYNAVQVVNGETIGWFNARTWHLYLYLGCILNEYQDRKDAVLWDGKILHIARGVLERVEDDEVPK